MRQTRRSIDLCQFFRASGFFGSIGASTGSRGARAAAASAEQEFEFELEFSVREGPTPDPSSARLGEAEVAQARCLRWLFDDTQIHLQRAAQDLRVLAAQSDRLVHVG